MERPMGVWNDMSLEYDQYRDEWDKLPEACIVSNFPLHLDIELTNRCNLSCKICPHHGPDRINERIPQDMDFELYKKIIDEGQWKGLKAIKLNYGGESLLYDKLIQAIRYAKKKGILDVQLNTNALLLNEKLILQLIDSGLDLIIITDYENDKQFQKVLKLSTCKELLQSQTPTIRIKTNDPDAWIDVADEIVPNNYFNYNKEEVFLPSKFKCAQPWQRFLILADGTVCSCSCGLLTPEKILGNAWHFTLEELWNGKQMKFLRYCHEFRETHLVKQCRLCPVRKEYIKEENKNATRTE